jgi:hypothetical protein
LMEALDDVELGGRHLREIDARGQPSGSQRGGPPVRTSGGGRDPGSRRRFRREILG